MSSAKLLKMTETLQKSRRKRRLILILLLLHLQDVNRSCWVHPYNSDRSTKGEFYVHYPDLRKYAKLFHGQYRMNLRKFENLLSLITPKIRKRWTNMRSALSPEHKFVLTLR